ncbi:unnamed protein product, partial [Effrenium voratum]
FSLIVSRDQLRAKTELRSHQTQGYRMVKDEIMSLEELLEAEKASNTSSLYFGRVMGPLILWAAFYCFLSPILWVIDKFGDMLERIPCVGPCCGMLADFLETLVSFLICVVSCCMGLACGLLAMAIAWIFWRPAKGVVLLAVAVGIFAAVGYFAYQRKGADKVRRRSSARQVPVGQPTGVEMHTGFAQPQPVATAVAAPAPQVFQVQCPEGCGPGSPILVTAPSGQQVNVQVPDGVMPGQMFQVQVSASSGTKASEIGFSPRRFPGVISDSPQPFVPAIGNQGMSTYFALLPGCEWLIVLLLSQE